MTNSDFYTSVERNPKKHVKGFFWVFTATGLQAILQIILTIILARILLPSDFGLVSAAMVIISTVAIFSTLGIGPALVQKLTLQDKHIKAAYTLAITLNTFFAIIVILLSNFLATFYDELLIGTILKVLAISIFIDGFSIVPEHLLRRSIKLSSLSKVQVASFVTYAIIGIILAFLFRNAWALVLAYISQVLVKTILLLIIQPHSKKISCDISAFKDLIGFSIGFSLGRIANQVATQGDNFVIGSKLGTNKLGLYTKAYQLMVTPALLLGQVFDKVLFPIFSANQKDSNVFNKLYQFSISSLTIIVIPLTIYSVIIAPDLILFLFGSNWVELIFPFQILALGMFFRTAYKVNDSLIRAKGKVYRRARIQILYAALVVFGSLFGSTYGLEGVAISILIALLINYLLMTKLSMNILKVKINQVLRVHFPGIFLGSIILPFAYISKVVLAQMTDNYFYTLAIFILVNVSFYIMVFIFARRLLYNNQNMWIYNEYLSLYKKAKNIVFRKRKR